LRPKTAALSPCGWKRTGLASGQIAAGLVLRHATGWGATARRVAVHRQPVHIRRQRLWCDGDMNALLLEYLPILIFLGIATVMGLAFILGAFILAPSDPDPEKVSTYECGFNAFDDARMKFDVRFYLVAILFIIFDLEVAFLFPWIFPIFDGNIFAFWSMTVFLAVLTVGFLYEWRKGALDWE
jgi:NADH-quinone oxidoreductase subunit A